jgi:hypothetical protein
MIPRKIALRIPRASWLIVARFLHGALAYLWASLKGRVRHFEVKLIGEPQLPPSNSVRETRIPPGGAARPLISLQPDPGSRPVA